MRNFNPSEAYGQPFVPEEYLRGRKRKPKYTNTSHLKNVAWESDVHCVSIPLFVPADIAHRLANDAAATVLLMETLLQLTYTQTTGFSFYNHEKGVQTTYVKPDSTADH